MSTLYSLSHVLKEITCKAVEAEGEKQTCVFKIKIYNVNHTVVSIVSKEKNETRDISLTTSNYNSLKMSAS